MENNHVNKRFELADPNGKILKAHKCDDCNDILYDVFECSEERCQIYCREHLPKSKKCGECGGELTYNPLLSDKIKKKYKIKCINCSEEMDLKQLEAHLEKGCNIECTQKCGKKFSSKEEIENHLKIDCINTIIGCTGYIGCKYKDKRGIVLIHEQICEFSAKFHEIINPLKIQIFSLQNENNNLKNEIHAQNNKLLLIEEEYKKQNEEIVSLKQKIHPLFKKFLREEEESKKKFELEISQRKEEEEKLRKFISDDRSIRGSKINRINNNK